jgi:hypothetical protein
MSNTTVINMFNIQDEPERIIWVDERMYTVPDANARVEIDWDNRTVAIVRDVRKTVDYKVRFTIRP